jgi:hypothetical protein
MIRSAAASDDAEFRKLLSKRPVAPREVGRIAGIELSRLVEFGMAEG